MSWWLIFAFLSIVIGVTFGIHRLTRLTGQIVGTATLRTLRTAEMIYETGRIPRSWLPSTGADGEPTAAARRRAGRNLDKLTTYLESSSVFADPESRAELLRALHEVRPRIDTDPLRQIVGPDPQVRRTVVVFATADGDSGLLSGLRAAAIRSSARSLQRAGYTVGLATARGVTLCSNRLKSREPMWPAQAASRGADITDSAIRWAREVGVGDGTPIILVRPVGEPHPSAHPSDGVVTVIVDPRSPKRQTAHPGPTRTVRRLSQVEVVAEELELRWMAEQEEGSHDPETDPPPA